MSELFLSKYSIVLLTNILLIFVIVLLIWMYFRNKFRTKRRFLEQKYKSINSRLLSTNYQIENVVLNLLPKFTAGEFIKSGKIQSKRYKNATVLFADIQGFSEIAAKSEPENLIKELDKCFMAFDKIIEKYNIEKIKTVGDAYLCVGGIPNKNITNAIEIILAALEFIKYLDSEQGPNCQKKKWKIRIGVHTGTVIGGSIGSKQAHYDIWGDTVNKASRLENVGEVGKINITEETYKLVKDFFVIEPRGKIAVKYYGEVEMYFIKDLKASMLSKEYPRKLSNHFFTKFRSLKYIDMEQEIFELLESKLSTKMIYHNLKHTQDVITSCELIAKYENKSEEEILLLKSAALLHDVGFILDYQNHEDSSIKIANETLKNYRFHPQQINAICNLINTTKANIKPANDLEKIMKDADLDYLGRHDYIPISNKLYLEMTSYGMIENLKQWRSIQIKFLEKHRYYTQYAIQNRQEIKSGHLIYLKSLEKNDNNS